MAGAIIPSSMKMPSLGSMSTGEKVVTGVGLIGGWVMGARIVGGLIGGPIGAIVGALAGNMIAKKL